MVHFSEYSGRVEDVFLPEDRLTEVGASISIVDAERAEQEARRANFQPGLVLWVDGGGVRGGVEEASELGQEEGPYGILQGGTRRRQNHCARPSGREGNRPSPPSVFRLLG